MVYTKIKLTEKILDYKGKPVVEKEIDEEKFKKQFGENVLKDFIKETEKTWQDYTFFALSNAAKDETMTKEVVQQCHQLCMKVNSADEVDLTLEQVAFILGRIEKVYPNSPLICGKSKEFFEPKEWQEKRAKKDKKKAEKADVKEPVQDPEK